MIQETIRTILIFSIPEFQMIHRVDSVVRGYFEVKADLFQSFDLLKNLFKDQIFYILGLKTSFFDECIAECNEIEALQDVVNLEEFETKLEYFFASLRDRLNASEGIFVGIYGLDDLSKVVFCDSEIFDMRLNFDQEILSFRAEFVYLEVNEKLVLAKGAKIIFREWTDYYALRCYSEDSEKDFEAGSDFFEPTVDLQILEILREKNAVWFMGSAEFGHEDYLYHFTSPKISGTLEWERKPIPMSVTHEKLSLADFIQYAKKSRSLGIGCKRLSLVFVVFLFIFLKSVWWHHYNLSQSSLVTKGGHSTNPGIHSLPKLVKQPPLNNSLVWKHKLLGDNQKVEIHEQPYLEFLESRFKILLKPR